MNYIPGFSNYLETSVPRYANGGAVMGDVALTPEQREARRVAANTLPRGTSIVGPTAGKKPLSFGTDNTFNVGEGQEVRIVDAGGNVIFSGSGAEGANRAVAVGQSLSDDLGKNANFKIQIGERTINSDGSVGGTRYIDVARAAPSQTGLGFLADYVLPFAATFIPGVGPVLGAALGSAASSAAQGRSLQDAIMRAAIAGGTAGIAQGTGLDRAIGGALSNTGGQAAGQVAGQVGAKALGAAGDAIVVSGLSKALQAAGGALGSAALSQAGNAASRALSGYKTPAEKFVEQPLPDTVQPPLDNTIVVSATRTPPVVPSYGGALAGVTSPIATEFLPKSVLPEPMTSEPAPADDTIVVTAPKAVTPAPVFPITPILPTLPNLIPPLSDPALMQPEEEIVVTAPKAVTPEPVFPVTSILPQLGIPQVPTPDPALTNPKKPLGVEDYLGIAGKAVGLLGNLLGDGKGGKNSGSSGTYIPGGAGSGRLNPIFSAQLPAAGALGTVGATRTARPLGDVDWLTYGMRPELKFFDYATQPANPAPVTSPVPGNPAGPIMQQRDPMAMFEGGTPSAKHGDQSRRTEFAVNGPGTGRSDEIPAVLSDGEYVIDAETVALLGDGSSKAGAKKLDDLRVKVRKHKGQKLAKGRFSANAKKPEAYLSGGRI